MTIYFKISALILVSLVIYLILTKQNRDVSTIFSIAVCCVITLVALAHLEPIISFLKDVRAVGDLDTAFTDVLFQALGIGILSEPVYEKQMPSKMPMIVVNIVVVGLICISPNKKDETIIAPFLLYGRRFLHITPRKAHSSKMAGRTALDI